MANKPIGGEWRGIVQIELSSLLPAIVSLVLTILGGFWTVASIAARGLDKRLEARFDIIEKTLGKSEIEQQERYRDLHKLQIDFIGLRAELPLVYVRREDYIRNQTVIETKLDAIAEKLHTVEIREIRNDRRKEDVGGKHAD